MRPAMRCASDLLTCLELYFERRGRREEGFVGLLRRQVLTLQRLDRNFAIADA